MDERGATQSPKALPQRQRRSRMPRDMYAQAHLVDGPEPPAPTRDPQEILREASAQAVCAEPELGTPGRDRPLIQCGPIDGTMQANSRVPLGNERNQTGSKIDRAGSKIDRAGSKIDHACSESPLRRPASARALGVHGGADATAGCPRPSNGPNVFRSQDMDPGPSPRLRCTRCVALCRIQARAEHQLDQALDACVGT